MQKEKEEKEEGDLERYGENARSNNKQSEQRNKEKKNIYIISFD